MERPVVCHQNVESSVVVGSPTVNTFQALDGAIVSGSILLYDDQLHSLLSSDLLASRGDFRMLEKPTSNVRRGLSLFYRMSISSGCLHLPTYPGSDASIGAVRAKFVTLIVPC